MSPAPASPHARITVDLAAIRHNVRTLAERVERPVMMVVKADGYGHGMVECARAAREAGAPWLGVATAAEALALREAGDAGRILCWLAAPGADHAATVAACVDVAAYSVEQLGEIAAAARGLREPAAVHLKVDTGLSRGGAARADWPQLVHAAVAAERSGSVRVAGIWSHLACADEPDHPANAEQEQAFSAALAVAADAGLAPEVRHLANSAGALLRPRSRHDLVRLGLAGYGLSPAPGVVTAGELGLVPAMTVSASVVLVKRIPAGAGVSYGHTFRAEHDLTVALVPLGYADGVPLAASSRAQVQAGGRRRRILGRVCMDQLVIEGEGLAVGEEVVLLGPGQDGEPTAQDWAEWCRTISYEILTRMGGRATREHR